MSTIQITQIKSVIGQSQRQKDTMKALGLRKINHIVQHPANPSIRGMIRQVKHLVITQDL